jgi:serine phosphatase RsbU (regulator of sigma subunit)
MMVVAAVGLGQLWQGGQALGPLLAVPPALAGIGAPTPRLPLGCGVVMLLTATVLAPFTHGSLLWIVTVVSVVVVTVLSAVGAGRRKTRPQELVNVTPVEQKLADLRSVAEVVQRTLLRPLPQRVGPLELGVVYLAAAAQARVGGDLYEVACTQFGIRLIIGDTRGKGLDAVETAAEVLGSFREVAHEVYTLAEVARRIDASLARRFDASHARGSQPHEEFVTALFAEIDPCAGSLTIYNCGHPPPILLSPGISATRKSHRSPKRKAALSVTTVDVPSPAPPLRLLPLGDCSAAGRTLAFRPGGALLLYTDGVTEAQDSRRVCYPLAARLTELAPTSAECIRPDLLERLRDDLLCHVGSPLNDDAALVLVRAPEVWGDQAAQPVPVTAS